MATSSTAAATTETQRQPASMMATPGYTTPSPALTRQPPAPTRPSPAPTMMRRRATVALFDSAGTSTPTLSDHGREDDNQDLSSSGRPLPVRRRRIGSQILNPDSQHRENIIMSSEEAESWTLYFHLIDAPPEREIAEIQLDRNDITFGYLLTMKTRLGYTVRDFLYYKKRSGNNVATLYEIETELDASGMITMNNEEREVRLVLSRDRITERNVAITPMKLPSGTTFYDDEFTNEPLDDYKVWLADLHENDRGHELCDTFRADTIKTYSEWLRQEGQLDDIEAYEELANTQSSQSNNPTPPLQRPSHARREKQLVNDGRRTSGKRKFKGRGPLKGFTVSNKRARQGTMKLDVEFSRSGGPVGGNQRSFVDEVKKWNLQDTLENKKKIWLIANARYKGWRSTFSATYKAYDTYDERMRHKPEDLHIVEWHYLVLYFGTEEFKELSNQNSRNRSLAQTKHMMGSKPFAQCGYELRDPQTGEEPDDCDLWAKTHSKGGKWTNDASKAVYETACSKIAEKEIESPNSFIPSVERNLIFQEAYKQATRTKSSKLHGKGYLARYPSRRQLMIERFENQARSETTSHVENEELKAALAKVQEQLQSQVDEREAEKEEHRRQMEELQKQREADKEQLRQEIMSMIIAQRQGPSPQVNQGAIETTYDGTTANETPSIDREPILSQREETTPQNEATLDQNNIQVNQKAQLAASTSACNNVRTTRCSLNRTQSENREGNSTTSFISSKHLTDAVTKRRAGRKN